MANKTVLLAGESWVSTATHIKGFDQFPTVTYHTGADDFLKSMAGAAYDVTFMPAHQAQRDFPQTLEALQAYDAIILSDLGSNTLLLHPDTWIHSRPTPNRPPTRTMRAPSQPLSRLVSATACCCRRTCSSRSC